MRVRKCPVCGKEFILSAENIYKARIKGEVKHLCSWGCVRELEREKEAEKKSKEEAKKCRSEM